MNAPDFVDAFGAKYSAAVADERPGSAASEFVFAPQGERFRDGLLVSVRDGVDWNGIFARGETSSCGLFGTPDPQGLLVLSYGNAYLVSIRSPNMYSTLESPWILGALPVPEAETLVVYNSESFWGIGASGVRWKNETDADGFEALKVEGLLVTGAMRLPWERDARLQLDARTGKLLSGALQKRFK